MYSDKCGRKGRRKVIGKSQYSRKDQQVLRFLPNYKDIGSISTKLFEGTILKLIISVNIMVGEQILGDERVSVHQTIYWGRGSCLQSVP